jgi:lactate dehydrogenase-like 2-hydroxyacid dehydrogenase
MNTVLVTERVYPKAKAVFDAAADDGLQCIVAPEAEAALADAVRQHEAQHAIVGVEPYTSALYEALPRGGVLARFGVGHDGIDLVKATDAGILCTNTPGVLADSVAEHAIALLLAVSRHLLANAASAREGAWQPHVGIELRGKTLAIIGCGAIGCRVARIAALGLGMEVIGCETGYTDFKEVKERYGFQHISADFEAVACAAHAVSLHIPATPENHHFLHAERIEQLRRDAVLINTARGALVEEAPLYDALADGRIAAAALDVFHSEPYVPAAPDKDLRTLRNVLMTPHVGSSTREACERMAARALHNILLAQRGEHADMDILNREALSRP